MLGFPATKKRFGEGLKKETNAWDQAKVEASKRDDSGSKEFQREFTREKAIECVVNSKTKKYGQTK